MVNIHTNINRGKGRHSRETCPRESGKRESTKALDSPVSSTGQAE